MNTVYKRMIKSRAASSVGVMYHFSGPNTGSNPGGGWILKKDKIKNLGPQDDVLPTEPSFLVNFH